MIDCPKRVLEPLLLQINRRGIGTGKQSLTPPDQRTLNFRHEKVPIMMGLATRDTRTGERIIKTHVLLIFHFHSRCRRYRQCVIQEIEPKLHDASVVIL